MLKNARCGISIMSTEPSTFIGFRPAKASVDLEDGLDAAISLAGAGPHLDITVEVASGTAHQIL